ncbi:ABC transporter permease [Corynebacterium diphtheriae]|nr:ABC transporter permease [Corynebacterium diphtheriae]
MFLGIRDIRAAAGRFTLIASVVGLITLLIVMLTGLTQGLGKQNTSAIEALAPHSVVFTTAGGSSPEFTSSEISEQQAERWKDSTPLGVSQTRIESDQNANTTAVMGLPEGTALPDSVGGFIEQGALLPAELADFLHVRAGDHITLGGATVTVAGTVKTENYSHTPVVWVDTVTWQLVSHTKAVGTVLLLNQEPTTQPQDNEVVTDLKGAFQAMPAYKSERSSLLSMQAFLYIISALVTVAFLTVWTLQRTRDIAVLAALGASKRYLLIDALGQAAIILAAGVALGAGIGTLLGWLIAGSVPFSLGWVSVLGPALGIWLLGLIGATIAVRNVTKVDPQIALGATA